MQRILLIRLNLVCVYLYYIFDLGMIVHMAHQFIHATVQSLCSTADRSTEEPNTSIYHHKDRSQDACGTPRAICVRPVSIVYLALLEDSAFLRGETGGGGGGVARV